MSQEAASAANGLKTAYDEFMGGVSNLESEIGKGVANFENTQTVFGNNFNTSVGTGNSGLEKLRSQELENAKLKAEKTDPFVATVMAGASGAASSLTFGFIDSKLAENADPALADYDAMSEVYMSEHPVATQVGSVARQLPYMALGLDEVGGVNSLYEGLTSEEVGNVTELKYKPTSDVNLEATPGKTTTVLGTYKSDTGSIIEELGNMKSTDFGPKDGGFNLLNTPDELYRTPEQFWNEYNKPWLDNVIKRGDIIKIATEPTYNNFYRINEITGETELTGFGREITYLKNNGYNYNSVTKSMVK